MGKGAEEGDVETSIATQLDELKSAVPKFKKVHAEIMKYIKTVAVMQQAEARLRDSLTELGRPPPRCPRKVKDMRNALMKGSETMGKCQDLFWGPVEVLETQLAESIEKLVHDASKAQSALEKEFKEGKSKAAQRIKSEQKKLHKMEKKSGKVTDDKVDTDVMEQQGAVEESRTAMTDFLDSFYDKVLEEQRQRFKTVVDPLLIYADNLKEVFLECGDAAGDYVDRWQSAFDAGDRKRKKRASKRASKRGLLEANDSMRARSATLDSERSLSRTGRSRHGRSRGTEDDDRPHGAESPFGVDSQQIMPRSATKKLPAGATPLYPFEGDGDPSAGFQRGTVPEDYDRRPSIDYNTGDDDDDDAAVAEEELHRIEQRRRERRDSASREMHSMDSRGLEVQLPAASVRGGKKGRKKGRRGRSAAAHAKDNAGDADDGRGKRNGGRLGGALHGAALADVEADAGSLASRSSDGASASSTRSGSGSSSGSDVSGSESESQSGSEGEEEEEEEAKVKPHRSFFFGRKKKDKKGAQEAKKANQRKGRRRGGGGSRGVGGGASDAGTDDEPREDDGYRLHALPDDSPAPRRKSRFRSLSPRMGRLSPFGRRKRVEPETDDRRRREELRRARGYDPRHDDDRRPRRRHGGGGGGAPRDARGRAVRGYDDVDVDLDLPYHPHHPPLDDYDDEIMSRRGGGGGGGGHRGRMRRGDGRAAGGDPYRRAASLSPSRYAHRYEEEEEAAALRRRERYPEPRRGPDPRGGGEPGGGVRARRMPREDALRLRRLEQEREEMMRHREMRARERERLRHRDVHRPRHPNVPPPVHPEAMTPRHERRTSAEEDFAVRAGLLPRRSSVRFPGAGREDHLPPGPPRGRSMQDLLPGEYRVLYAYRPTDTNQLELAVGDIVQVRGDPQENWQFGFNTRNKKSGWFPRTYLDFSNDQEAADRLRRNREMPMSPGQANPLPHMPPADY